MSNDQGKLKILHPITFSLVHYLWYISLKGWHLAEIGLSNVISDSLSLIRTTVHIILICFPTNISILHWLTEKNLDVVQNSTCTNDDAHFFWSHTNFRMENIKTMFPAAKTLFNDYPCFTMSIIVSNLSWVLGLLYRVIKNKMGAMHTSCPRGEFHHPETDDFPLWNYIYLGTWKCGCHVYFLAIELQC